LFFSCSAGFDELLVLMQHVVENGLVGDRQHFNGAGNCVAAEGHVGHSRQCDGLHLDAVDFDGLAIVAGFELAVFFMDLPLDHFHRRVAGEDDAGRDADVVSQGNTAFGHGPDQALLARLDLDGVAAGKSSKEPRARAHIRALVDCYSRRNTAFDHRLPQGAGVEIDEGIVHDGGAVTEMGTIPDHVHVGHADTRGNRIGPEHGRELIHGQDLFAVAHVLEPLLVPVLDGVGAFGRPHQIG